MVHGQQRFSGGAFGPTLPAGWRVVGAADFNGDANPDYALFNPSTGQSAIWYLSGVTFVGGAFGPTLPSAWTLVAVGDFNSDCNPDYVLYNASTGQTAVWYMNNNVLVAAPSVPLFRVPGEWWVRRILIGMDTSITSSSTPARVSLRSGISLGPRFSEAPLGQPCNRLSIDRGCRFQRGRQAGLRALQLQHATNSDLVHEQQRFCLAAPSVPVCPAGWNLVAP